LQESTMRELLDTMLVQMGFEHPNIDPQATVF
jgi:hypothetical protein